MNGHYAGLLEGFAAQRHSAVGVSLRSLAQRFDTAATDWKQVAESPGWRGRSADAATAQFSRHRATITTNGEQLLRAAGAVDGLNALIDFARGAYEALPTASIPEALTDQFLAGAQIFVEGVGRITDAQGYYTALQTLHSQREQAAQNAVARIQTGIEELSRDLGIANSGMLVSHQLTRTPDPRKRRSLSEILREYQVRDDPGGKIWWQPKGINRSIASGLEVLPDAKRLTASECELLDGLNAFELLSFNAAHDLAFSKASDRFPSPDGTDGNDNHTDAFRHAYWNAILSRRFGPYWTAKFTTAHESDPSNPGPREAMDLYNNEVGREIAGAHPNASEEELADHVEEALRDGRLVVLAPDGQSLEWSDRVPIGGAGKVDENNAPALPGKDPKKLYERVNRWTNTQ